MEEVWKIVYSEESSSTSGGSSTSSSAAAAPKASPEQVEIAKNTKKSAEGASAVPNLVSGMGGIGKLAGFIGAGLFVFNLISRSTIFSTFFGTLMQTLSVMVDILFIPLIPFFAKALQAIIQYMPVIQLISHGIELLLQPLLAVMDWLMPDKKLTETEKRGQGGFDQTFGMTQKEWDDYKKKQSTMSPYDDMNVPGVSSLGQISAIAKAMSGFFDFYGGGKTNDTDKKDMNPGGVSPSIGLNVGAWASALASAVKNLWNFGDKDSTKSPAQFLPDKSPMPGGNFDFGLPAANSSKNVTVTNNFNINSNSTEIGKETAANIEAAMAEAAFKGW